MQKLREVFVLLFFLGIFPPTIVAQILTEHQPIIKASENLLYSNPNEALQIALQLTKNKNNTIEEKASINLLIAKAYYLMGNYSAALKLLFDEKQFNSYLSETEKFEIQIYKVTILRNLALDKEAKKILAIAYNQTGTATDLKTKHYFQSVLSIEKAKFLLNENQFEKGIQLLLPQKNNSFAYLNDFPDVEISYCITLGEFYLRQRNFVSAEKYYNTAQAILKKQKNENIYFKTYILSGLADVHFFQKNQIEATAILNEAFNYAKKLRNAYLEEKIVQQQTVNFLALHDINKYKLTNYNFIKIHYQSEGLEQDAVNSAYNLLSDEYANIYIEKKSYYCRILYYIIGLFFVVLIIYFIFLLQIIRRKNHLNEIVNYVNITRNNFVSEIIERKQEPKKNIILKGTEEQLLQKLKRFENSKRFINKDISLAVLAGQLDSNTKYLSEIINSHYQVNFNTYINTLRINYIIEKLKTDPNFINYKISYLAENAGFASHSSFATIFKSITGISPVKFIELLKEEKENTLLQ